MESLAALWTCGRNAQTRTQRSITSGWGMRRRPSLQALPLRLWQISRNLLGRVDCFLFKRRLVFGGEVSRLHEYCADGVNGSLHELRGGCGRRRHAASHASSSAARVLIGRLGLQIAHLTETVQITKLELK